MALSRAKRERPEWEKSNSKKIDFRSLLSDVAAKPSHDLNLTFDIDAIISRATTSTRYPFKAVLMLKMLKIPTDMPLRRAI